MRKLAIIAIILIFLLQLYIIYLLTVTNMRIEENKDSSTIAIQNVYDGLVEELNNIEFEIEYTEIK